MRFAYFVSQKEYFSSDMKALHSENQNAKDS